MLKKERIDELRRKLIGRQLNWRIVWFLLLFAAFLAWIVAHRLGYLKIPDALLKVVDILAVAFGALLIANILVKMSSSKLFHALESELEVENRILLLKSYTVFLYAVAIAIIFWRIGIPLSNITLFLGLVTTGIAFAIKDVIMSWFCWYIILTKRPFRIGDTIKLGDDIGVVERIGTFFVTIDTGEDNQDFTKMPTRIVLDKTLVNMGKKRVIKQYTISIKEVPKDMKKKLQAVRKAIEKKVKEKENIKIKLDVNKEFWYVIVSFPVGFYEQDFANSILEDIHEILKDILQKPK